MSIADVHHAHTNIDATDPPRRGHLWRSRWAAIGAAVAVTLGGGTLHLAGATDSEPSGIVSITPARVVDTRVGLGFGDRIESRAPELLQVTGSVATPSGDQTVVPVGATGVLLNITAVLPGAPGFISVRPAGTPGDPETSSLNFEIGEVRPNAVFVALPTSGPHAGQIEVTYDAYGAFGPTTDFLTDVVGYTTENPDVYTKAEADALFLTEVDAYTRSEADESFLAPFAVVEADGTLARGRGVVSVTLLDGVPNGRYQVIFDRDISACAYNVTTGRTGPNAAPAVGFGQATNVIGSAQTGVGVFTRNQDGIGATRDFHLTVHC